MKVKPTLECETTDFNDVNSILGTAWRARLDSSESYQCLVRQMALSVTGVAQRAFLLGVEAGKKEATQ